MPYTVTRQIQWPEGTPMVEVSAGGIDYTNPDALVVMYPGEFEAYDDPREVATTAIEICRAWCRDGERRAKVSHGATGGMTMPFDSCTYDELRSWAERAYQELRKCDRCGDVLPQRHYVHPEVDDEAFCSEYCAEEAARSTRETEEPE